MGFTPDTPEPKGKGFTPDEPSDLKKTAAAIYRPIMEVGGGVGGGVLGSSLGPAGTAGGAALGFGTGKAAADLTDRLIGLKEPIKDIPEAIKETGENIYEGGKFEATNLAAGPVIKAAINNPLTRAAGNTAANLGQWATNIKAKDYKTLFKNPEGILPGSLDRAGANFARAAKEAGLPEEMSADQLGKALSPKARKIVVDAYTKIERGVALSPAEAQEAKQMVDAIYPMPTPKNGRLLHFLDKARSSFQDEISKVSPSLKEANKQYAIAKAGDKFKAIMPKTNTGQPAFFRTGAMGALALKNPLAAAALTPIGQGIGTAGAGLAYKAAQGMANNPVLTAPMAQALNKFLADKYGNKKK